MAGTNRLVVRVLSGVTVAIAFAAASAGAYAQDTGQAASSRTQDNPAAGIARRGQTFSVSKLAPENLLEGVEEEPQTPRAQKGPAQRGSGAAACAQWIHADIVALAQPYMLNRLGAAMPNALIFALRSDVRINAKGEAEGLKDYKRARPIVLRVNEGDCIEIKFTNLIQPYITSPTTQVPSTTQVSIHVQGMQLVKSINDDGSFVGRNETSLASLNHTLTYQLFAEHEGTFLLYSMGDTSTQGNHLLEGLFGAVNVQPAGATLDGKKWEAEWYRSQVTGEDLELATKKDNTLKPVHTPIGQPVIDYDALYPPDYNPTNSPDRRQACTPILKMLDVNHVKSADGKSCVANGTDWHLFHTDLTAIITGPKHGRFPGTTGPDKAEPACNDVADKSATFNPLFCTNSAEPDRKQPYREVTVIYHEVVNGVTQAFPIMSPSFQPATPADAGPATTAAGRDYFAINYGTGGIGAEIYANRIGVGPMGNCVDCKFEEFFLSAWPIGDPAMVVDTPANSNTTNNQNADAPCTTTQLTNSPPNCSPKAGTKTTNIVPGHPDWYHMEGARKATKAFYPDDPSNVYHSYLDDHVKFRIHHGGTGVSHVHHQHAHQWLQSPNNSDSAYLDSQMISPGASYTLEMVYNGSGNRNKTVGDSIFHCHFYPHFAAGMWAMWRVHDVFEQGTKLDKDGKPDKTAGPGARALPDGEIVAGTPIAALVPLPTRPMALMPSLVFIDDQAPHQGQVVYGTPGTPDFSGDSVKQNPGYPFFIPGVAGARAPHPPLDFAPNGDGGLPRHVVTDGTIKNERHTNFDWSKDFGTLVAKELPEDGTNVEKVAIKYFSTRCHPSFNPDGTDTNPVGGQNYPECIPNPGKAFFIVNGLPNGPQPGAPFADPAVLDNGKPVGKLRRYKAAAFELDVTFNYTYNSTVPSGREPAWHYPQERMLSLWEDVAPTINYRPGGPSDATHRQPEPLFFRADSKNDFIEYWHTNLVPNYYKVDDFQVRTPTDILGQHIHLVKFDVTSSDGAGNGFNYEDGTFSPDEVRELIHAIQAGTWTPCPGCPPLGPAKPPPSEICGVSPPPPQCTNGEWVGTQTTVQRWYPDPLDDNPPPGVPPTDRTIRTVFTHDHFGPSTHQQAGLYAGLLVEPEGSKWENPETGQIFGGFNVPPPRPDGGPTSWKADILTQKVSDTYREFALEYQDLALAYQYPTTFSPKPEVGYRAYAPGAANHGIPVNPPGPRDTPTLISTGGTPLPGTQNVNYLSEPIVWRYQGECQDFSQVFRSDCRFVGTDPKTALGDPKTPLMRAYENDKVQVRLLVGAHTFSHFFTMAGPKWPAEPSWKDSGYRSSQGTGISEHFELLFNAPATSKLGSSRKCPDGVSTGADCVDYIYSPSNDDYGLTNGLWGIFRAYDPTKPVTTLKPLPNNPLKPGSNTAFQPCPATAPVRKFDVMAITAQAGLPGGNLVFNDTNPSAVLSQKLGIMYVFTKDLDQNNVLGPNAPREPLILRAAAGECVEVTLRNGMDSNSDVFSHAFQMFAPFNVVGIGQTVPRYVKASPRAALSPQLLSFDAATSSGVDVGYNQVNQAIQFKQNIIYKWYAGNVDRDQKGALTYTPVELGSLNLFPADPLWHHINSLFGAMVVEPAGSTWKCDKSLDTKSIDSYQGKVPCDPSDPGYTTPPATRASATVTEPGKNTHFREFVAMVNEDLLITFNNTSAINYKTDPTFFRYGHPDASSQEFNTPGNDNNCAISNALVHRDPATPIFGAIAGTPTRFRLIHPQGTGTVQVFTLAGHVWQRNPYVQNSKAIGNNQESQWLGSHDNHAGTDHFDLVVEKAGGKFEIPGDYLYTTFLPVSQNPFGSWGVFRVAKLGPNGQPQVPDAPTSCTADPAAKPLPARENDLRRFIRQPLSTVNPQQ